MVHRLIPALVLLAFVSAGPAAGQGGGCICLKEPRDTILKEADVVFVGKPTKVSKADEDGVEWETTVFAVDKWLKGRQGDANGAEISIPPSVCAVRFKPGTGPFTVAAFLDEKGRLITNSCIMLNISRQQ